jgi:radical SAM protein with 4Fe4S-binding SPASM domain
VKKLAKDLGADTYHEKTMFIDYNEPGFQDMAKEFLPEDPLLRRYFLKEDGTFAPKGVTPDGCHSIYLSAVINSDGTVVPCCRDMHSDFVMGNVFEEDLKDIWKNDEYRAFREQVKKDRKSIPMCDTCPDGRFI